MLMHEIVHSCSNDHVAQAALGSIGGAFAARIVAVAENEGLTSGELAAAHVARFRASAQPQDWQALSRAIRHADQPVLAGLRHILESELRCGRDRDRGVRAARVAAEPQDVAWR